MNAIELTDERLGRVLINASDLSPVECVRRALTESYSHAFSDAERMAKHVAQTRGSKPLRKLSEVADSLMSHDSISDLIKDRVRCLALGLSDQEIDFIAVTKSTKGKKKEKMQGTRFGDSCIAIIDAEQTILAANLEPNTPRQARPNWFTHLRPGEYVVRDMIANIARHGVDRPTVILIGGKSTIPAESVAFSVPGEIRLNRSGTGVVSLDLDRLGLALNVFAGVDPKQMKKLVELADERARNLSEAETAEKKMLTICNESGRLQSVVELALDPKDEIVKILFILLQNEEDNDGE